MSDAQHVVIVDWLDEYLKPKLSKFSHKLISLSHFNSFHALNGNAVAPGEEQQKLFLIFERQFVENLPKHSHRDVARCVAILVLGIGLEHVPLVVFVAHHNGHQLVRLEELHDPTAANLHEALVEAFVLLLHRLVEDEVDVKLDEFPPGKLKKIKSNLAGFRM